MIPVLSHNRRRIPTPPAYKSSTGFGLSSGGGTTIALVIPAGVVAGDLILASVIFSPGSSMNDCTPPAGFTLLAVGPPTPTASPVIGVYYHWAVAGDAGASKTWTAATNRTFAVQYGVYSGVAEFTYGAGMANAAGTQPTHWFPERYVGPQDLIVTSVCMACRVNLGNNGADIVTTPSPFTLRRSDRMNIGLGQVARTVSLFDAPAHDMNQPTVAAIETEAFYAGVTLVLHPPGASDADKVKPPASLMGKSVFAYGESYMNQIQGANSGTVTPGATTVSYVTESTVWQRLRRVLGTPTQGNNLSIGGTLAIDDCNFAYSTWSGTTQSPDQTKDAAVNQIGTWLSQVGFNSAPLVVSDMIGNDILKCPVLGTNTPQGLLSMKTAVIAFITLMRSASMTQQTDVGSIAYNAIGGAGWNTFTSTACSGGSAGESNTSGNWFTITVAKTDIDIVLIGLEDGFSGHGQGSGAPFQVQIDGVLVSTGTTSNQITHSGEQQNKGFCQMIVPCHNMGPGTHVIKVTQTGAGTLLFDGWLTPSLTPPTIVMLGFPKVTGVAPYLMNSAWFDQCMSALKQICESYPDGKVIYYDPNERGIWKEPRALAYDQLHKSDWAERVMTYEICTLLRSRLP